MGMQTIGEVEADQGRHRTYSIGELARELNVTPRTLRHYEDQGLVRPGRSGQSRIYSRGDRARLMLICRGKRLGFSLADIHRFLELYDLDETKEEQVRYCLSAARDRITVLERQRREIDQTLQELRDIETAIKVHLNPQSGAAT